jgi:hypothetical protein
VAGPKPDLAHDLVDLLVERFADREIHIVANAAYGCGAFIGLSILRVRKGGLSVHRQQRPGGSTAWFRHCTDRSTSLRPTVIQPLAVRCY